MGDGRRKSQGNVRWAFNEFVRALAEAGVSKESTWQLYADGGVDDVVLYPPDSLQLCEGGEVATRKFNLGRNLYGAYGGLRLATYAVELVASASPGGAHAPTNVTPIRQSSER